eukprot:UN30838
MEIMNDSGVTAKSDEQWYQDRDRRESSLYTKENNARCVLYKDDNTQETTPFTMNLLYNKRHKSNTDGTFHEVHSDENFDVFGWTVSVQLIGVCGQVTILNDEGCLGDSFTYGEESS